MAIFELLPWYAHALNQATNHNADRSKALRDLRAVQTHRMRFMIEHSCKTRALRNCATPSRHLRGAMPSAPANPSLVHRHASSRHFHIAPKTHARSLSGLRNCPFSLVRGVPNGGGRPLPRLFGARRPRLNSNWLRAPDPGLLFACASRCPCSGLFWGAISRFASLRTGPDGSRFRRRSRRDAQR